MTTHTIYLSDKDPDSIKLAEMILSIRDSLSTNGVSIKAIKISGESNPTLYIDGSPLKKGYNDIHNYYTSIINLAINQQILQTQTLQQMLQTQTQQMPPHMLRKPLMKQQQQPMQSQMQQTMQPMPLQQAQQMPLQQAQQMPLQQAQPMQAQPMQAQQMSLQQPMQMPLQQPQQMQQPNSTQLKQSKQVQPQQTQPTGSLPMEEEHVLDSTVLDRMKRSRTRGSLVM